MEIGAFILILAGIVLYFLPTIIAAQRHTQHAGGIVAVNFFFGWTVLGWLAALIWAIVEKEGQAPAADFTEWGTPVEKK